MEKQAHEGIQGAGVGGGWGPLHGGALYPCRTLHGKWPSVFPQVMNMYGDLVMDTVPEKVGQPDT